MKALVALLSVAVVSSSHVLEKRSLLRVGQDHEHHHDEHERTGRDSPVSAPAGYLPPAEDDYADYDDDSAGLGAGKGDFANNNVRGQDSENEQSQYGQNQRSPESGAVGNAVGRQSANGRNQQDGNQRVKFGQRINQNLQNPGLTRQQGSRRNQQGRGRNQQKAQRNNQFDLENDQDGSLGTYGNEIDQNLNNQQQDQPGRQENSQRGQGINSQFDNLEDSTGQSQYGQTTPQSGNGFIAQSGQRRQGQQNQAGGQRNQQRQGISLQSENNQFDQGLEGNSQTQSGQLSQGGQGGQGQQQNSFGNQQLEDQPADAGYGVPGQGQSNKKLKIGPNKRGENHRGQNQRGHNQFGQNQRGQNQRGENQRGQNQQVQGQSADESYGAPGQEQDNIKFQNGQNQRDQSQRGQNQKGQQNLSVQNQRGENQVIFNQGNKLGNQQVNGQSADESYGAPSQGQGNINSQIGQNQRGQSQIRQNQTGRQNNRGQNQIGLNQSGQNQVGFSQGNDLENQQVQDQSANESYGAPDQGQDNNKFQIVQRQRGQNQRETNQQGKNQRGQNQGGQNGKRQNQRGQNRSAFPNQIDSPVAIRPTINRFLPSNKENQILNSEYGAPPTGQNSQGSQSGQNSQREQTGTRRNGNTGNSFAAQGVQPGTGSNRFPFSSTESNDLEDNFKFEDTLICPGGSVESCIKVCPGNTALLYGGCVQGCAERCDAQGQGSQFGQQGIPGQNVQLVQQGQPIISGQSKQQGQTGQSQGAEDLQGQYGQQTA